MHPTPAFAEATFNARLTQLINEARASNGLPALVPVNSLVGIAESAPYSGCGFNVSGRAADLGKRNYFSHTIADCGGRNVFDMMRDTGVAYERGGENIGWLAGTTDATTAANMLHNSFMGSQGHRDNVLNGEFNAVGVGSWFTADGQTWSGSGSTNAKVVVTAVVFAKLAQLPPPPPTATVPGTPTNVTAAPGNGAVSATWSPVPGADGYAVLVYDANGYTGRYVMVCGTCTSASVSGLANGQAYAVGVLAGNSAGWGGVGYSAWVTAGTPSAPRNAAVSAGTGQVRATWAQALTGNGASIQGYAAVAFSPAGFTGAYQIVCGTCTSATISGLARGTAVQVIVVAYNANGWGAPAYTGWVNVS